MKIRYILYCLFVFLACSSVPGQQYQPRWESLDTRKVPEWFVDAKFGLFIHWGVYSVPAWSAKGTYAEWYWNNSLDTTNPTYKHHLDLYGKNFRYQDFAPMFKAELFDADKWADLFVRAGIKYVVPTSKHHDGFCLWPSAQSPNWNSVDIGPHRDLLGELTAAGRKRGLEMGFYYSLYEWYNPLYHSDFNEYVRSHFIPQFQDVVTRYKPSIIFADGEWEKTSAQWRSAEAVAWLFNESSVKDHVVIDDRWGSDSRSVHGGYYCTEYGQYATKEMSEEHPWEENRGMGASFGVNRNEDIEDYRTPGELIRILATTVSQGGNLLLDIGPNADGTIPVIMQERLLQMGDWLHVNGESIYSTRPYRSWSDGDNIRFTRSKDGKFVYATVLGKLEPVIKTRKVSIIPNSKIRMLGAEGELSYTDINGELSVQIPDSIFRNKPCEYAWVLKMEMQPYCARPNLVYEKSLSTQPISVRIQSTETDAETRYTLDGSEPAETSARYTRPLSIDHAVFLKVKTFKKGFAPSETIGHKFSIVDVKANGVAFQYYEGAWDSLPAFGALTPAKQGTCLEINLASVQPRPDEYAVVFTTHLSIANEAVYTFYLTSDDGSRLFIDGKLLIDNDKRHAAIEKSASLLLAPGKHSIKIEYFEASGSETLQLQYSSPDMEKQTVPAEVLFLK